MGICDFFCSVSGGRFFEEREEFRDAITEDWPIAPDDKDSDAEDVPASPTSHDDGSCNSEDDEKSDDDDLHLSDAVRNGLLYSQEDVDSSSNFVLLCPYTRDEDGTITFLDTDECPDAEEIKESNIMEVFNVVPGNDPDVGDFQSEDHEFNLAEGSTVLIMYSAYLIVKQASPRLKPHMICHLVFYPNSSFNNVVDGVDYGPVAGIQDQTVYWMGIISDVTEYEEQEKEWQRMLTDKGKTDEEILYDAWRGRGNMWVFVRPDRFPVAETLAASPLSVVSGYSSIRMNSQRSSTFDALPVDILILICHSLPDKSTHMVLCTNRGLRSRILPHINMIAYQQIITYEPHLLPAGPFDLQDKKHGREEIDWWNAEWAKGGIAKEELTTKIPWFLYRRECSKSMSMWNRRRIWGIAKQLESLAINRGLLLTEDAGESGL